MNEQIDQAVSTPLTLTSHNKIFVKQILEPWEWFGFETRNKFQIVDEQSQPIGYAVEQKKGFFDFLMRQFLGHWRSFEFHIFNHNRQKVMTARQPFRFFFQRLEVFDENNRPFGAIQQRFAILSKRFEVQTHSGQVLMEVRSPFFKIWTFPFTQNGREVACIRKKWSGIFTEAFTDRDTFLIDYSDPLLSEGNRRLILSSALFIDLRYFETKARRN